MPAISVAPCLMDLVEVHNIEFCVAVPSVLYQCGYAGAIISDERDSVLIFALPTSKPSYATSAF